MMFLVKNAGPKIVSCNYWGSDLDIDGRPFLSLNDGAFRLLLPAGDERQLWSMAMAREVVISHGRWNRPKGRDTESLEVVFDDASDVPFVFFLDRYQWDSLPAADDAGKLWLCTVWVFSAEGKPAEVLARRCRYRQVKTIPCHLPRV